MRSKTLFCENFNKTLFRKNLTRFWPLWAAPSFVGALFPLAMLTQLIRSGRTGLFGSDAATHTLEFAAFYYEVVTYALPILSLCYAVLVAIAVWSYLFNARSVGMMHTLPVRRKGLFLTNFLSGMTMMLIPYAVTGALSAIISICYGFFEPVSLLLTVLSVIGESLFYFGSATLVAFVTGNLFAMPVLYFIFHFLAAGLDMLVNLFANGFIFGLSGNYSGVVEFLSPTVYLMTHVRCDRQYVERFEADPIHGYATEFGIGHMRSELVSVSLEKAWIIAVYALVGVVLLGIAYALYSKRRSESAGDVVAVGWMKPVFRYGVSICGAMVGGLALYAVFWGTFQNGEYYDVVPLVISMLIAGAISYYAASMLLAKSLRVFRGNWKGLLVTALCAVVICGTMYFDVFGVETRVPTADQIAYVSFSAADNSYTFYPDEDVELLERVRKVHLAIAEDADYIVDMEEHWRTSGEENDYDEVSMYNYVRISYYLKNGIAVHRRYDLPMVRTRMQDPGMYDYALSTLINSEAMKSKRFHLNDGYAPDSGSIYLEAGRDGGTNFGNREATQIMNAVAKDIAAGTCGVYRWFEDGNPAYAPGTDYALDLGIEFRKPFVTASGQTTHEYDHISVRVRPEMTNTVSALLDLGLVTRDALKTRAELYPEDYREELLYWEEKYGYGAYETTSFPSASEIIYDSGAASVGIIGGADGPTAVFVTGG